jgi:hypothetical protein
VKPNREVSKKLRAIQAECGLWWGASTVWGNEGDWSDNALGNEIVLQARGVSLMQSFAFQVS